MDRRSPAKAGVQPEEKSGAGAPPGPRPSPGNRIRFAGYAAVFDRVDRGGDIIRRGAFVESLARNGEVPLLLQHKAGRVIGRIEHLSEDSRGLRVIGRVRGVDAARVAGSGLSFGYRVREARSGGPARELLALDLVEVSLVAQPMQRLARVHAVEPTA